MKILHVLPDFTSTNHFHDHGEVLFILRCFIVEIEHKGKKQHRCCLIPERVLGLASLGGGVLEQVGDKPLNIVVGFQIHKGIVAVTFLHVDKVNDLYIMGLGKVFSAVTQHFTFGVQHHIAAVGVHKVRLGIEPGFTGTGTAADKYIQVAPVFSAIHTNRHILG